MYPSVEQYFAAIEAADQEYNTTVDTFNTDAVFPDDVNSREQSNARNAVESAAGTVRAGRYDAARAALMLAPERDARWIAAQTLHSYTAESHQVLRALPVNEVSARKVAAEYGFSTCHTFISYLRAAQRDRVVEDTRLPERQELDLYITEQFNSNYSVNILRLVDALVEAEVDAARREQIRRCAEHTPTLDAIPVPDAAPQIPAGSDADADADDAF